ncbi:hypothetical protein [Verrucomicrobium sp. BvORR034]|uniref:hypothetical protein n=1 Tax=Verrucomicrobium sp. BvORR034 TaxID=1396418 RepID=UPI000678D239|nr:hypothetical protein [Verrucomicrobium sp. BvORR034]
MKNTNSTSWTAAEIALRWAVHPASVLRIMRRFGIAGAKFGTSRQSARRFSAEELKLAESYAQLNNTTQANHAKHDTTSDCKQS